MKKKAFKLTIDKNRMPVNSLGIPWVASDIISSNCPKHAGVRLTRINDTTYQCPHGKEIYKVNGSVSNQTNRDNYYLGFVVK